MENDDYIEFVGSLNPNYSLPCRKKLRDLILEEYEKIKEEVSVNLSYYKLQYFYSIYSSYQGQIGCSSDEIM